MFCVINAVFVAIGLMDFMFCCLFGGNENKDDFQGSGFYFGFLASSTAMDELQA